LINMLNKTTFIFTLAFFVLTNKSAKYISDEQQRKTILASAE